MKLVQDSWNLPVRNGSIVSIITAKLKRLRHELKHWGKSLSHIKGLIEKCNWVILFMDQLEDQRTLTVPEFNFRNIVKVHLKKLLGIQSDYWKQRCTVRWVQLNGENTKYFHARATERFRQNTISSIIGQDGEVLIDHDEKATAFWQCYKGRMGVTRTTSDSFGISSVIQQVPDLDGLAQPFSSEEIENVVKFMKPDKAPGPDGFTGHFIKQCWPIIKGDFYKLCSDFSSGAASLQSINGSLITLVPKKQCPETVNDYRPISLTNTCLKFLTKIIANRFQKEITRCIHANQYGFIKSRTIQDCLAWSFEYIHQCKQSKRKVVLFKIDFEKAFDTIEHSAILKILECKGFPPLVIEWVKEILSSGSSSILLNGIPGRMFHCKRGVRQGDPLSPLLFVLGGDLLQSLVNRALRDGLLQLPIPVGDEYPIVQYADDTLIVLPADPGQLQIFKDILVNFAAFTGLKVNFHKSSMIPINLDTDEASALAQIMECQMAAMPFTYLGLPMGSTRPTIKDMSPLVDRIERRLSSVVSFLSYGDSLVLINSVLSSLPTYFMCTLVLPKGIIEIIDRARRRCLWRKDKNKERVNSLASWEMVCRPKDKGGLGIINLQVQNRALLLKHLDKFYNNADLPWVKLIRDSYYFEAVPHAVVLSGSFWWRSIIQLADDWRGLTKCVVGSGFSVLFWEDLWLGSVISASFPRLYSFARDKQASVNEIMSLPSLADGLHLPLSEEAFQEYNDLMILLTDINLNDQPDSWIYKFNKGNYTPKSFYGLHFAAVPNHGPSKLIWKSKCMSKHKVFAWLVLHDRINTKDMMLRRQWKVTDNNDCVLCHAHVLEDRNHLFFECQYSARIWAYLQFDWSGDTIPQCLSTAKKGFPGPCFAEVLILACWNIWKQRNGWIFKNIRPSFRGWKAGFVSDMTLLMHRLKRSVVPFVDLWLKNLS